MPEKFNELLLKQDIIELYNAGITPDYGYLMNGRFERDMVKTLYPLKTLSGNPITWEASDTEYLFPVVSLEPKQAGSGDPSPENVRPISGYDSLSLTRCGKNLWKDTIIENDGAFTFGFLPPGTYTFSMVNVNDWWSSGPSGKNFYLKWGGSPDKTLGFSTQGGVGERNYATFTLNAASIVTLSTYIRGISTDITDIQLELGSTPTDYEPYQGETYDIAFPETVYGGAVDVVTGVGSKTWGHIASYNGESLPGEWISDRDVYASGTTPATGAQVAYKLATPESFQTTGNRQLTSLVGYNTIYTTGDSITLSRKVRRLEV